MSQEARHRCRLPAIMGDAAHTILVGNSAGVTGNFYLDEEVLRARRVTDFAPYRHPGVAEADLVGDFFV